jgi:hypothetical protein
MAPVSMNCNERGLASALAAFQFPRSSSSPPSTALLSVNGRVASRN